MWVIGVDEAGRGCFLGDVVAACVVLPEQNSHDKWNEVSDSKKIKSMTKRNELAQFIKTNAIAYGIGTASPNEIDNHNILQATMMAMHRALDNMFLTLKTQNPENTLINEHNSKIFIDGCYFKPSYKNYKHECVVRGDDKIKSISAASILAKTTRDDSILKMLEDNPNLHKYGLKTNMGYGTKVHRDSLLQYGTTPFHRKTFIHNYTSKEVMNKDAMEHLDDQ